MNELPKRRALRAETTIDYCGSVATVLADDGGDQLTVICEGYVQRWYWKFEGAECTVVSEPRGKLFYDTFDAYVADYPEGERFRAWLTARSRQQVTLIRLTDPASSGSPHGGIPGNFMAVTRNVGVTQIRLAAHDCDDGLMVRDLPLDEAAANQVVQDMKLLAPYSMWDAAKVFDFRWV